MIVKTSHKKIVTLMIIICLMTSCGGGSSGNSSPSVSTNGNAVSESEETQDAGNISINTDPICEEYQSETIVTDNQTAVEVSIKRCMMKHDGLDRSFYMYVPETYSNSTINKSLLFSLHGYTSNALYHMRTTGFKEIASTEGFIVIYPQGSILQSTGATHWNVGGWTTSSTTDDVGFIETIIQFMAINFRIDTDRIYSTGMSNGGFMSYHLACNLGSKVAAIASVTGSMTRETYEACDPDHPIPIMQIHGVKDEVVPYAGNSGMKAIEDVIDYWSQNNRCDDTPDTEVIPDLNQDGSGGMKTSFMNCQNEVEVTLYLLDSMEHEWPLGDKHDLDAPSTIWQFLSRFNRYGSVD